MSDFTLGHDLMAFIGTSSGSCKSIGFATNHTLNINGQTTNISCKDFGKWGKEKVSKIEWEITSENFYSDEMEALYSAYTAGNELFIKFGEKAETTEEVGAQGWTPATSGVFSGKAIIRDIQITAQEGEVATFNITFRGCGELAYA